MTAVLSDPVPRISADAPDWSREKPQRFWDPGRRLLASIRGYQRYRNRGPLGRLVTYVYVLKHRFWSVVSGADVPLNSRLGGGLLLPHPNGVVIHPDSNVGPNCLLFQQVTLGHGGRPAGVPRLGGHVDVGAGAKILGGVVIGDHAKIGANAVVLCDVPAGATAVGIPARIIPALDHEECFE
ncbi:serine O-acetyltransferase [Fimbriiglobus ruber]|uniref:Serine acetyltransferase n=1 Tax=Fimbriiglobus ruber TaxID=1908690 RepID=A0A225D6L2_9BACT|nr:serine acetyltransferase [Fimbriiglobus ruber]OWK34158.1 Serine acetyltransferase [Fimbriiglobus ruber]